MLLNIALSFFGTQSEIVWEQSQILTKGKLAKNHYDSAPRPQISCYTNPNEEAKKLTYFFLHSMLVVLCKKILVTSPTLHFQTHIPTGLSEPGRPKGYPPPPPFILADHGSFYLN